MARPLRVEFDNASYHVTARGNHREAIFGDDAGRATFLGTLGEAAGRFGLLVQGYCLMLIHYRDGSGVLRVAQRLEAKAKSEAGLRRTLEQLERAAKALSNVKI